MQKRIGSAVPDGVQEKEEDVVPSQLTELK